MIKLSIKTLIYILLLNSFCNSNYDIWDEVPQFETRVEAMEWVYNNIEYDGPYKTIHTPEDTVESKKGDCKGSSALLMYIFVTQFGDNPSFVMIDYSIANTSGKHAIVESNGTFYDPINNVHDILPYSYSIIDIYSYDYTIFLANTGITY